MRNGLAWGDGKDYHFSIRFLPGSFVIRVWDGANVVQEWVINDSTYLNGKFGYFINSLQDVRFGEVLVGDIAPIDLCGDVTGSTNVSLQWLGGEPPFRLETNTSLSGTRSSDGQLRWDRTATMQEMLTIDRKFYRILSIGESLTNP